MASKVVQPRINATLTSADVAVENTDQRVLFIGPQGGAATAGTGLLSENIANGGAEDALYAPSSLMAGAIRAFKKVNSIVMIDGIGIDDAAGTAATFTITMGASSVASEAGTLIVVAGSEKNHKYEIAVASGDTEDDVGAAIAAAIEADTKCPFAAAYTTAVVTLTAENMGAQANSLGVEVRGFVAGITSSPGAAILVATGATGATEPSTTGALDVIGDRRYQGIVWIFSDLTEVMTVLNARFNVDNKIQDGVCFHWIVDSHANALSTLGGSDYNSQSLVVFCDDLVSEAAYEGPAMNEAGWVKAAQFAAVRSLRLTDGASISQFLTSNESLDQFGGTALASLPYFNTPFPDLPINPPDRGWTDIEIEQLFDAGGSMIGTNSGGDAVIAGEVVTTYLTDSASNPDPTWQFLNAVDVMSNAREYFVNNWRKRFAQARLTTGSAVRGRGMVNRVIFTAYTEQLYLDLTGSDFVLGVAGEGAIVFFKQNLTVVITMSTGTITTTMEFPMVVGMREILATIKVVFSTEG